MKKFFKNMLASIEEANKQNFGNKKMDCCDLNQGNNEKSKTSRQGKSNAKSAKQ